MRKHKRQQHRTSTLWVVKVNTTARPPPAALEVEISSESHKTQKLQSVSSAQRTPLEEAKLRRRDDSLVGRLTYAQLIDGSLSDFAMSAATIK